MGWVFVEIVAALAVAVIIVWWTMAPRRGKGKPPRDGGEGPS